MRMFLFDRTVPERDGELKNDLVVQESTLGIMNPMTRDGTGWYARCCPPVFS